MAVARLPLKLRRIVPIRPPTGQGGSGSVDFDLTFTARGIEIRLAGTTNRKKLFRPWHEILDGAINERKGYRVYGFEPCVAQLEDVEDTLRSLE